MRYIPMNTMARVTVEEDGDINIISTQNRVWSFTNLCMYWETIQTVRAYANEVNSVDEVIRFVRGLYMFTKKE